MDKLFEYSVLKYVHSPSLGEELNIGVLCFFPLEKRFIFKFPERLGRVKSAFHNFQEKLIKEYLKHFSEIVNVLNSKNSKNSKRLFSKNLKEYIDLYFIKDDDSSLQFDQVKISVQFADSIDFVADSFYSLYLGSYQSDSNQQIIPAKTEKVILGNFNRLVNENSPTANTYFKHDYPIGGASAKTRFEADVFWQNGTGNLVKAISFDLKEANRINDKAILFTGKLNYLTDIIETGNYRVDLLVASPSNEDLLEEYNNSLEILNEIRANKRIITDLQLKKYAEEAANDVKRIAV